MTVIVASRNPEEFSCICQRALVLAEGRLLADAPVTELQRSSRHYQAITLAADTPWTYWRWPCFRGWLASKKTGTPTAA